MTTPQSVIKVLLVDDSPLVLQVLQRQLSNSPEIQVVGTAANGSLALNLLPVLKPDVICTDLHMPVMDGLELTRAVMEHDPRPILVVTISAEPGSHNVFSLLEAGAVDIFPKPKDILSADQDKLAAELASKIRILAGVKVFRRNHHPSVNGPQVPEAKGALRMVVIGASTGGPQALHEILKALPADFPIPVVCVQHIGSTFVADLVLWLHQACALQVCVAVQGVVAKPGVVYFAPAEVHLEWDDGRCFLLSRSPPVDGHQPSVTVTMNSAARCFGAASAGVLLTGMGSDGADGMLNIATAGGMTIAQDEASCIVYGMPKAAVERGAVQIVLPLEKIAQALRTIAAGRRQNGK